MQTPIPLDEDNEKGRTGIEMMLGVAVKGGQANQPW